MLHRKRQQGKRPTLLTLSKTGIGEAILKEGNYVSVDALRDLLLWNIDTYIMTQKNVATGVL